MNDGTIKWNPGQPQSHPHPDHAFASTVSSNAVDHSTIENKILSLFGEQTRSYFVAPLLNSSGTNFAIPLEPFGVPSLQGSEYFLSNGLNFIRK